MTRSDEQGMALLVTLLIIAIVSAIGLSMANYGATDLQISDNYRNGIGAFYAADSGLEQSVTDFLADDTWASEVVDTATWSLTATFPDTVTIAGVPVAVAKDVAGDPIPAFYPFGQLQNVGAADFTRQVFLPPTVETRAASAVVRFLVRSSGTERRSEPGRQAVRAQIVIEVGAGAGGGAWDQVLAGGDGGDPDPIDFSDTVDLRGPVNLVGNGAGHVTLNGDLTVGNNYAGIDDPGYLGADASKLPPLTPQSVNGEDVETLNAVINILDADLVLEHSDLGAPDVTGNGVKETLDGTHVEGGQISGSGHSFHVDESTSSVTTSFSFPHLDGPYCADPSAYPTQREYIEDTGLEINDIDGIDGDTDAFTRQDGAGNFISWDPDTGVLRIEGIIIFADDILLGDSSGGPDDPGRISYEGSGTIYAPRIEVKWDLIPTGDYLTPDAGGAVNSLGLVASERLEVAKGDGGRPVKVMAAMFSDDEFRVDGDSRIAGAMVGAEFTKVRDVQAAYVPTLKSSLPPGMPGCLASGAAILEATIADWYHER